MPTYTLGHDDRLSDHGLQLWAQAMTGVRYVAARLPMDVGRVITCAEMALTLAITIDACARGARGERDTSAPTE